MFVFAALAFAGIDPLLPKFETPSPSIPVVLTAEESPIDGPRLSEPRSDGSSPLLSNASLLLAIEASREPQDLGINANFGAALAVNTAVPLTDSGLGVQFGVATNLSRAGVKVLRVVEGTNARTQTFFTGGLFQRGDDWHAAVAFDWQYADYFDHWNLGQFRSEIGRSIGPCDEIGVWGATPLWSDTATIQGDEFRVRSMRQLSAYWRRTWQSRAQTAVWIGVAGSHGTDILTAPDRDLSGIVPVFGLEVNAPLTDKISLFGQGNFVTPSDTGTLDAYLGFAYHPGGGLLSGAKNHHRPVLAVANNPTFPVDLRRR